MTWVFVALGLLAVGVLASILASSRGPISLATGLAALVGASACCVGGGISVLASSDTFTTTLAWRLPLGAIRLAIDGLSAWFLLLIGVTTFAAAVYSWGYFDGGRGRHVRRAYTPLLCVMVAAMILVVSASDVVAFLVGWELMSVSAFFLVGLHDDDAQARHGAWMYLMATHIGTALGVLPVLGAFAARSGTSAFSGFGGAFSASETWICVTIFILGVIGFGTKSGFVPFHVWLPVAHPVAPSPVSALMSGVVIKTGIYGLLRLLSWLPDLPASCGVGLGILAMITALLGILFALAQREIKRMLAYSSVENIGIIGLGIAVAMLGRSLDQPALVALGLAGALLHALNHALFKGLLFLSAGAVMHGAGTGDIESLGGLARRLPAVSMAFLIGSVAICGLPPLNGFLSEFLIYMGLLEGLRDIPMAYAVFLASCAAGLALVGAIALAAFTRVFAVVFLGEARDSSVACHAVPRSMVFGLAVLSFACVAVVAGGNTLPALLAVAVDSVAFGRTIPAEEIGLPMTLLIPILLPLGVLSAAALLLVGLRRRMPGRTLAGATWGCGYAAPAPSIQYTGSSYAWTLLSSFRPLVRSRRRAPVIAGCFPSRHDLETNTPDLALLHGYRPVFRGLSRAFEGLRPLQHGRIQLYLLYIVATVLAVFLVEAWQTSYDSDSSPGTLATVSVDNVSGAVDEGSAAP